MVSGSSTCTEMKAARKERTFTEWVGRIGAGGGACEGSLESTLGQLSPILLSALELPGLKDNASSPSIPQPQLP